MGGGGGGFCFFFFKQKTAYEIYQCDRSSDVCSSDLKIIETCYEYVRNNIEFAKEDRIFSEDIEKAKDIITSNRLVEITDAMFETVDDKLKSKFSIY